MRVLRVDDGVVTDATVGDDAEFCAAALGGFWIVSDGDAGIGWTYDVELGFRPPQPYPSWSWVDGRWSAPLPEPDGGDWFWDESSAAWLPVEVDQ
jgi:hypothetical protein